MDNFYKELANALDVDLDVILEIDRKIKEQELICWRDNYKHNNNIKNKQVSFFQAMLENVTTNYNSIKKNLPDNTPKEVLEGILKGLNEYEPDNRPIPKQYASKQKFIAHTLVFLEKLKNSKGINGNQRKARYTLALIYQHLGVQSARKNGNYLPDYALSSGRNEINLSYITDIKNRNLVFSDLAESIKNITKNTKLTEKQQTALKSKNWTSFYAMSDGLLTDWIKP